MCLTIWQLPSMNLYNAIKCRIIVAEIVQRVVQQYGSTSTKIRIVTVCPLIVFTCDCFAYTRNCARKSTLQRLAAWPSRSRLIEELSRTCRPTRIYIRRAVSWQLVRTVVERPVLLAVEEAPPTEQFRTIPYRPVRHKFYYGR